MLNIFLCILLLFKLRCIYLQCKMNIMKSCFQRNWTKWVFKARSDICQFGNEISFPFEHEFDFWAHICSSFNHKLSFSWIKTSYLVTFLLVIVSWFNNLVLIICTGKQDKKTEHRWWICTFVFKHIKNLIFITIIFSKRRPKAPHPMWHLGFKPLIYTVP